MNLMVSIILFVMVLLMPAALRAAQSTSENFDLTISVNPDSPTRVTVWSDGQTSDLTGGKDTYKITLPKLSNTIIISVRWPSAGDRKSDCGKQLKLRRVNKNDDKPNVGVSCIPFHLDIGLQGITDISNITVISPNDFDKYLTAKAAVLYYFDPERRQKSFGTRVLDALAIWHDETERLMKSEDDRALSLDYDVELSEEIKWTLGNYGRKFTERDLADHACAGLELQSCLGELNEYLKNRP